MEYKSGVKVSAEETIKASEEKAEEVSTEKVAEAPEKKTDEASTKEAAKASEEKQQPKCGKTNSSFDLRYTIRNGTFISIVVCICTC